jgi:hypothetical protein
MKPKGDGKIPKSDGKSPKPSGKRVNSDGIQQKSADEQLNPSKKT